MLKERALDSVPPVGVPKAMFLVPVEPEYVKFTVGVPV